MYLALQYGQLTNTWVAYCREDGGLASSNNMTRHKGGDKPLLFQPMPPLDLACLRDCQKNAFIIPQNMTARIFSVMHDNEENSNELIAPSSFWFSGFFYLGFSVSVVQSNASSFLLISRRKIRISMKWIALAQLNIMACRWNQWQTGTLSLWARREGKLPVLLKEMNDFVLVLDLLGKEFMRMANSISTTFMTWPLNLCGAMFRNTCFFCVWGL